MAEAATTKGLTAARCLNRLKMVCPRPARQLFTASVAPVMDCVYGRVVACTRRERTEVEAQNMGVPAITGAFWTVTTAVAEAEASIQMVYERRAQASIRTYVNIKTLPARSPESVEESRMHASVEEADACT
jgi:hypothetical protein